VVFLFYRWRFFCLPGVGKWRWGSCGGGRGRSRRRQWKVLGSRRLGDYMCMYTHAGNRGLDHPSTVNTMICYVILD